MTILIEKTLENNNTYTEGEFNYTDVKQYHYSLVRHNNKTYSIRCFSQHWTNAHYNEYDEELTTFECDNDNEAIDAFEKFVDFEYENMQGVTL